MSEEIAPSPVYYLQWHSGYDLLFFYKTTKDSGTNRKDYIVNLSKAEQENLEPLLHLWFIAQTPFKYSYTDQGRRTTIVLDATKTYLTVGATDDFGNLTTRFDWGTYSHMIEFIASEISYVKREYRRELAGVAEEAENGREA